MKRIALMACAVLLTATVAQAASVDAMWSSESAGGGYTRYILTVMPQSAGITLAGFDVRVTPGVTIAKGSSSSAIYYADKDAYSHFLLNDADPDTGDTALNATVKFVSTSLLRGAFAVVDGGMYQNGFSSNVELLQIVSNVAGANPMSFAVTHSDGTGSYGWATQKVTGAKYDIHIVPEPGTLALLASGLVGLLAYAWRKRK